TARSGSGANAVGLTPTRDQFRADLGGGTTPAANGSFGGLRREINWDGVPAAFAAPNNVPANFFNANSPRGLVLATPGSGFQVSGASGDAGAGQPAAANFGNFNALYSFQPFSAQRLVTPVGSHLFDVNFYVAGTSIPAVVTGFGAVFADVDLPSTTSLQFFDRAGTSLGMYFAPAFPAGLSFVGAFTTNGQPAIARVRITEGNAVIGSNDNGAGSDVVVSDDFIYGEPRDAIFADGFE
ncbi:MAG: hypothetical protein ABIS07_14970, partial [Dokdonella sp.]